MGYMENLRAIVGTQPLLLPGSITIILNPHGHILLQQRHEPTGYWGLPGGLMELGESFEETACREVLEETNLTISNLQLIDIFSGKDYYRLCQNGDHAYFITALFTTNTYTGELTCNPLEGLATAFFPLKDLPSNIVRSHLHAINRYLKTQPSISM